jgi:rhamnulokinase
VKHYLAIDLGAESGRGLLAAFDGERLILRELGRFATNLGDEDRGPDGVYRWGWPRLLSEIRSLVSAAIVESGGQLGGVAVDSWGVDFGLLDDCGQLLEDPVKYRDESHVPAMEEALGLLTRGKVWDASGIQFLPFNTLYQLVARHERDPEMLNRAATMLLIPDLAHYFLCGARVAEISNASTTQLLDPIARAWRPDLPEALGLPAHYLPPTVEAGARLGTTPEGVPVWAPATHDTASAVAACPVSDRSSWAFLSSGTWSLVGVERGNPVMTEEARDMGLSNELGAGGKVTLLTNIMGLWLVQECRRVLQRETGQTIPYEDLTAMASSAPTGGPVVDVRSTRFLAPRDMPAEIRAACVESGKPGPEGIGPLIRCCLDSLAASYREVLRSLEAVEGRRFDTLHIVGGGSRNRFLNQLSADACGIPVLAGSAEATAIGNVLAQMVGSGEVASWSEAREVARTSFDVEVFHPGR